MVTNKSVFVDEKAWETTFRGWEIVDCSVRDRGFVYVLLRETIPGEQAASRWDHEIPSRLAVLYTQRTDPDKQCGHQQLSGFLRTVSGVALSPVAQGLALSMNGDVFAMGSGKSGMEAVAPGVTNLALHKSRLIGDKAYAVGMLRDVYRRVDIGKWERIAKGLPDLDPESMSPTEMLEVGFRDIDGFAEDDLYAVGGKGDVWHHDGNLWIPCEFPANLALFTVCCAGDGNVYISGEGGTLYQGRGDVWKRICKQEYTVPYNDSLWFGDRLWLASDYMLDWLVNGAVEHVEHGGRRVNARGHLDARDGILVVAGHDRVMQFDGTVWRDLVMPYPP